MEDIRLLRASKGMSQTEASEIIGVSRSTLARAESGKPIRLISAIKIVNYFGIKLKDLKGEI